MPPPGGGLLVPPLGGGATGPPPFGGVVGSPPHSGIQSGMLPGLIGGRMGWFGFAPGGRTGVPVVVPPVGGGVYGLKTTLSSQLPLAIPFGLPFGGGVCPHGGPGEPSGQPPGMSGLSGMRLPPVQSSQRSAMRSAARRVAPHFIPDQVLGYRSENVAFWRSNFTQLLR